MAAEVSPGEACNIKGVTALTGPGRGGHGVRCRGRVSRGPAGRQHTQPGRWGWGEDPRASAFTGLRVESTSTGCEFTGVTE